MINIDDLFVFIQAAECCNFSETGRNLHLSQPAISQKIHNLQKHFGTKLFVRDGRSMRLTEAGQALKPLARELLSSIRHLDETMFSLQGEVIGEMTIGCSTASGKYLLPGMIASFRKSYPLVRINVQVTSRNSVMEKLLNGDIALGVSSKKIAHAQIEYREFFRDDVILIVPAGHKWVERSKIHPEEILKEPIILREKNAGTREVFMHALMEQDISPDMLNVAMELGNAEAIEMAVEQGIGIAYLSRLAAQRGLELGYISEVPVQGMELVRDIYLARCTRTSATRAQVKFWEFVKDSEMNKTTGLPVINCDQTIS
jgi:DNA-binding transcriptional LysR family regulator